MKLNITSYLMCCFRKFVLFSFLSVSYSHQAFEVIYFIFNVLASDKEVNFDTHIRRETSAHSNEI